MDSHKGDFGAVGILGGAPGMAGAALLAGRAALACGAGRVYVGLLDARVAVDAGTPELMLAAPERLLTLPRPACLVAGPGLGLAAAARDWLRAALALEHAVLFDADALNLLAGDDALLALLRARAAPSLITPHPGEAARLLGETPAAVQAERPAALRRLQRLTGACVVLKGAQTLVGGAEDEVWRNETGNPGMAAPGMGDVLAGLIAALQAQGMSAFDAARTGVWLHGAAGDAAVQNGCGPVGLAASELIPHARRLLNQYLVTD
ncbi:MAG: NAD(P)H-hydrate dehydratase [Thiobacillaceae bacterium]|nr:NAD(P)H-hydrate dehydratase [Thiobacillaceae bacterium]